MTQVLSLFEFQLKFMQMVFYPLHLINGTNTLVIMAWFKTGLNKFKLLSMISIQDVAIPIISQWFCVLI